MESTDIRSRRGTCVEAVFLASSKEDGAFKHVLPESWIHTASYQASRWPVVPRSHEGEVGVVKKLGEGEKKSAGGTPPTAHMGTCQKAILRHID